MPIEDVDFRECETCGKETEWWLYEGEWHCVTCSVRERQG